MASKLSSKLKFIDSLRVHVKGGAGGMGNPRLGGVGGKGGDVYMVAEEKQTLKNLVRKNPTKRFSAQTGMNSKLLYVLGEPGKDVRIPVPIGVSIKTEHGRSLGELNRDDDSVLVAKGGVGGCSENQFSGQKGQAHTVVIDLKLIADIGLVGFPNAGKSTLLRAVSRASPKVAAYPFTTIRPELGILEYDDLRQIKMADLPGLIEGAHYNVGMGHKFLKHVERTKLLLFVVDVNGFQLGPQYPFRSAFETVLLLNKELELYKEELLHKPAVLVINKMDLPEASANCSELIHRIKNVSDFKQDYPEIMPTNIIPFDDIVSVSAQTGTSMENLRNKLRHLLDYYADVKQDSEIALTA